MFIYKLDSWRNMEKTLDSGKFKFNLILINEFLTTNSTLRLALNLVLQF